MQSGEDAVEVLTTIRRKLEAVESKPDLQANFKRHYEHLESLAASLRTMGMDEKDVSDEIIKLFEDYERVLADYIEAA
jgi:hypothetical protein